MSIENWMMPGVQMARALNATDELDQRMRQLASAEGPDQARAMEYLRSREDLRCLELHKAAFAGAVVGIACAGVSYYRKGDPTRALVFGLLGMALGLPVLATQGANEVLHMRKRSP